MKFCFKWLLCLLVLSLHPVSAHASAQQDSIYLYSSPLAKAFFSANGSNYDTLLSKWRQYLDSHGRSSREISRGELLAGLKPGVLILGSAILLDDQERSALRRYAGEGGSLMLTWGTGVRDANGRRMGYGLIEELLDVKVVGVAKTADEDRFLSTFGDSPLTWELPARTRLFWEWVLRRLCRFLERIFLAAM